VSRYVSARAIAKANKRLDLAEPRAGRPTAARLFVSETRRGIWIVRDAGDRRGGRFFTYEAAMKYVRTEFGPDAYVVATYQVHTKAA
jgi:hypothetical protein